MAVMKNFNGDGNLQAALALLVQNQAALVAQHTAFLTQMTETNKRIDETNKRIDEGFAEDRQRFARIEKDLDQIKAILVRHEQMLADLPEAIRQKIGFQPK